MTEHGRYRCVVKEQHDGHPFLVFEPMGAPIKSLGAKLIALELVARTTIEEARALAENINKVSTGLSLTHLK